MFRILATVAASGAALLAPALPAAASSAQPTAIVGFASSVSTVAYQQPVTFTGELVAFQGVTSTPVPNEPVHIEIQPTGENQLWLPVAGVTTGSGGQFTVTSTLPSGGRVRAAFAGDTGLGLDPSFSDILVSATTVPSRLVLDPVPGSVPAGTPVTFSGTVQVQVNGAWQPFQGFVPLTLTAIDPMNTYGTSSGPDGQFTLTEPVTQTSYFTVDTSLQGGYDEAGWFPQWSQASYGLINGVSKTQMTGFSLPAQEEAHRAWTKGLYATGTAQRWNGSAWVGLAYGTVTVYYRPKGSATWRYDLSGGQTGASGHFRVGVGIHLGTSQWQVRVVASADTLTSTSATVTSTITDRTHFASAQIRRSSSGSSIYGQVTDWRTGQRSFSSLRGLKLRLYYRPAGSRMWHASKTTKVHADGFFSFTTAKSHGYQFKVVLPAQGPFLPCSSRIL
jgi:hypothetical protein